MNPSDVISHRRVLACILATVCLSFPSFQAKALAAETVTKNCDTPSEGEWAWTDRSGQSKTDGDLRSILTQHDAWINSAKKKGRQADLSGAKLKKADLRQVNLSDANLTNSDLSYADLTRTSLSHADLRGANFECARLKETNLQVADLTEVDLSRAIISSDAKFQDGILLKASFNGNTLVGVAFAGAKMNGAKLSGANLTNASFAYVDLRGASLQNARLIGTDLNGASLEAADLLGAIYQVGTDPAPNSIAFAKNIEYMTHSGDSTSLADLRRRFKELGFRDQERKITFALKSRQAELLWETCENDKGNCFEYFVNRYLFDLPSQYGMNPGRVLIIILSIVGVSTVLYLALIHFSKDSGLVIIVPADQDRSNQPLWLQADLDSKEQEIKEGGFTTKKGYAVQPRELHQFEKLVYCRELIRRERALLRVSFFFSLMSTFNIKFRDVDFGRWLRQLTTKEYDIKAVGLARTVSGIQALLSVYFIALLLVTYFGRPFE